MTDSELDALAEDLRSLAQRAEGNNRYRDCAVFKRARVLVFEALEELREYREATKREQERQWAANREWRLRV